MKEYICPKCNAKFLECDLVYTKCSENQVGRFLDLRCKKCCNPLILRADKRPLSKQRKKETIAKEDIENINLDKTIDMS